MKCEFFLLLVVSVFVSRSESASSPECGIHCFLCRPGGICYSCNSGWYGPGCRLPCSSSCSGGCHKTTGFCLTCPQNTHGHLCSDSCSYNCRAVSGNTVCGRRDGHCTHGCKEGYYGSTCTSECGHCKERACERSTGDCVEGCTAGWREPDCTEQCLPNCLKCNPYICLQCDAGYSGTHCNTTRKMTLQTNGSLKLMSTTDPVGVDANDNVSRATVGISLGITFTVLILLVIVCLLLYTQLGTFVRRVFKRKRNGAMSLHKEPMYVEDDIGSPRISRSYLKIHEIGVK